MNYKPRPGVVLTQICGVSLLIPTRAAYQDCPSIHRLSLLWAATWGLLTKKTDDEIRARLDKFCLEMYEKGYMIAEEEPVSAPEAGDAPAAPPAPEDRP